MRRPLIAASRAAGFRSFRIRGDTDFSQTKYLDGWHEQGVTFCFGMDLTPQHHIRADDLPNLRSLHHVIPAGLS